MHRVPAHGFVRSLHDRKRNAARIRPRHPGLALNVLWRTMQRQTRMRSRVWLFSWRKNFTISREKSTKTLRAQTGAKRERDSAKQKKWSGLRKCLMPDHPVRSTKGGFATSLLMSRPPLLIQAEL